MSADNISLQESDIDDLYAYIEKHLKKPSPLPPTYPPEGINPSRSDRKEFEKECHRVYLEIKYSYDPWMHDRRLLRQLFELVKKAGVKKLYPAIETAQDGA